MIGSRGPSQRESQAVTIRVLCIASGIDRPMHSIFLGLAKRGMELEVMCPRASEQYQRVDTNLQKLEQAGMPVTHLTLSRNIDLPGIRIIRDHLKRNSYDIVHAYGNRQLSNSIIAARGVPLKLVTYRGNPGNLSFLDPISWLRYLNPRIDRIVCVADAVRDSFLSMRPAFLRMPAERPVTIYKGHDLSWYQEAPADLSQFGIPPDAFVVGCVANARPRKGLDVLIDAAQWLAQEQSIHLLLVGQMNSRKLQQQIAASPARDRIHLTGFREDAPSLMAACDLFILPVRKREGLSRAAIEAMSYGTVPIVTDCGGNVELVEHGVSGLVIPPNDARAIADAIESLRNNPEMRCSMGAAARDRIATHFNVEDTISKTLALYQQLLAN